MKRLILAGVIAAALCCGAAGYAADHDNSYSDELSRLPPAAQAARLANAVGFDCIGTRPFLMGVTKTGKAKGYAYWSIQCAGRGSYAIQITPDGETAATDCDVLKENGGPECFKKF